MQKSMRYIQIAEALREQIQKGIYPPGTVLASQKSLSTLFSTSIMTIRQALDVLEKEGLLEIKHGIGTFVTSQAIHGHPINLQGFQDEMHRQTTEIETQIIEKIYDITSDKMQNLFKSGKNSFCKLTRLRLINGIPVILQYSYLESAFEEIIRSYTKDLSLYEHLSTSSKKLITQGKEIISPIILQDKEKHLLECKKPSAAFLSKRISLTYEGNIVLFDEAYMLSSHSFIATFRQGQKNAFRYLLNVDGLAESFSGLLDTRLWEDLI